MLQSRSKRLCISAYKARGVVYWRNYFNFPVVLGSLISALRTQSIDAILQVPALHPRNGFYGDPKYDKFQFASSLGRCMGKVPLHLSRSTE